MAYSIKDFQHERDSEWASKILTNSTTDSILKFLKEKGLEKVYIYLYESSCPQLTEKNSPKLFDSLDKVCKSFGLETRPKIFVTRNYNERIFLRGVNEPFIVFSSEYLKKLDKDTLTGILAGQVAGIRCKHHTIFYITWGLEFASSFVPIPFATTIVMSFINEWKRNRWFTYDKAFALATNNRTLSLQQVLINVVPKNILDQMNSGTRRDVFVAQANRFVSEMNNTQAGIKEAVSRFSEKDWLPERYTELKKFFDEGRTSNHV